MFEAVFKGMHVRILAPEFYGLYVVLGSVRMISGSPPLPQLFPNLNQRLHLLRRGGLVVNQAAIAVRLIVEIPDGWEAQMCGGCDATRLDSPCSTSPSLADRGRSVAVVVVTWEAVSGIFTRP